MAALNQVPSLIGGGSGPSAESTASQKTETAWTPREVIRKLWPYIRAERWQLLGLSLASIGSALLNLLAPMLIARSIDLLDLGTRGSFEAPVFTRTLLYLLVTYGLIFILDFVIYRQVPHFSQALLRRLREECQAHLSRLPLADLDDYALGDLLSRLTTDLEALQDGLQQVLLSLFSGLVSLVGSLIMIFVIDWRVALLVLAMTPLNYLVTRFIAQRSRQLYRDNAMLVGNVSNMVEELTSEQELLRSFGYEGEAAQEFKRRNDALYVNGQKAQFISSLTNPATRFVNNLLYVAVGGLAASLGFRGLLSIGEIAALLTYALRYSKPVNELASVITEVQRGLAGGERALRILEIPMAQPETGKPDLVVTEGAVEFRDLSFGYDPERPLIRNFSYQVAPGSKTAIVGPTGAGKTTLVNLLMRFYDYQGGAILIDDQPIHECTRESVRASFGMVLQETWLFSGSIHANIAYGKPDATREEVIEAAKAAHCDAFIRRLPEGYDTRLDDATSLSEGQKQLITIARVMLTNPKMLILDEATSSIDTHTERQVQEAFLTMMEGRSSFIIAHRLSTIRDADQILFLVNGQVVEHGTHDELIAKQGAYYELYQAQFVQA